MSGEGVALPRWISLVAGVWLSFSALLWPHEAPARANAMIVGALVATISLYAVVVPRLRRLNTALAIWFIVTTLFVFDHADRGTIWHNAILGLIILGASLPSHARLHLTA